MYIGRKSKITSLSLYLRKLEKEQIKFITNKGNEIINLSRSQQSSKQENNIENKPKICLLLKLIHF